MANAPIDGGTINIDGEALPVMVLVNPRARRLILRLGRERTVRVTCPSRRHVKAALAMVSERRDWITDRLSETPAPVPFDIGETIPVLGEDRLVIADPRPTRAARLIEEAIVVGGRDAASVHRRIEVMLRKTIQEVCTSLSHEYAHRIHVKVGAISVRQMTSRWGSCAVDGNLSFNWRLVFAPYNVVRYVVAHEVAHRRHMDHSRKFWALVQQLDPDYEAAAEWLRRYGATLHAYGQTYGQSAEHS